MKKMTIDLPDDLKEAVFTLVTSSINRAVANASNNKRPKEYMSKKEVEQYIGISAPSLLKQERKYNSIPSIVIGSKTIYKRSDVDSWIEQFRH